MRRAPAVLAILVLGLGGTLTGCSGGDGSDYCNRVRDNAENDTLEKIDPRSSRGVGQYLREAKRLQADAPAEVKEEYDLIVAAFEKPDRADQRKVITAITKIEQYDEDHCDVKYENS